MEQSKELNLKRLANNVRIGIIEGVYNAGSGHPGGSLSIADLITYLYFEEMNIDPKNPKLESRDRFVLSKGHTAPVPPPQISWRFGQSVRAAVLFARVKALTLLLWCMMAFSPPRPRAQM